jgi:hypothetical protein
MWTLIAIFGYVFVTALGISAIAMLFVEKLHHRQYDSEDQLEYLMKYSRLVQERNAVKQYLQHEKPDIDFNGG